MQEGVHQSESQRVTPRSSEVVDLFGGLAEAEARDSFYAYRCHMRPNMLQGWWTQEVALALEQFYSDLIDGKRPKLAIEAPPQHGKSWAATDFITWMAGKNPNLKSIYASYSADLGVRTNLDVQRMIKSPRYPFANTRIDVHGWVCNTELIEYVNHAGSFRNTTIDGAINGMELHLGVIDDPVKGRAEARAWTH